MANLKSECNCQSDGAELETQLAQLAAATAAERAPSAVRQRLLAEMRLQALETRIDADLHLGRHAEVITELRDLAHAEPLREHLHALLMMALYRCGRQAEALAVHQAARAGGPPALKQLLAERHGSCPLSRA